MARDHTARIYPHLRCDLVRLHARVGTGFAVGARG
jgi:hypothetical protein